MTAPWIHVVDDDEAVRTSLLFALQVVGFNVAGYAAPGDFLARGMTEQDILVCDVRMPEMNGIELTRLLRRQGSTIPIILMTGNANAALRGEAVSAGANAILEKPSTLDALLAEISRFTADQEVGPGGGTS